MDNGAFGLLHLQVNEVAFEPYDTPFERCVMEYFQDLHRAIHGRRSSTRSLPFDVNISMDEASKSTIRTVVLQIVDSSCLYIFKERPEIQPAGKHLHEMHVVAWGSELDPQDLVGCPNHRLQMLGDDRLYVLLDRIFEVRNNEYDQASYLGLMMSKSRLFELEVESRMLEERMNYDLESGYQVTFGLTKSVALSREQEVRKAKRLNHLVFGPLRFGTLKMSQVVDFETVLPFFKQFAFMGYPRAVNFRQNIATDSLYKYLKLC